MADGNSHQVIIIGAGMSGLCMGIALLRRGIRDFVILEKSPAVGGTWYDNSYPGACCDVPSVLYSYSFAPKADWSRRHAPHDEIRAYFEDTAAQFGLRPHLRLSTAVKRAAFGDDGRWQVELESGERLRMAAADVTDDKAIRNLAARIEKETGLLSAVCCLSEESALSCVFAFSVRWNYCIVFCLKKRKRRKTKQSENKKQAKNKCNRC